MNRSRKGIAMIATAALLWSLQGVLGKANPWGSFSLVGVRAVFATLTLGLTRKDFRLPRSPRDWLAGGFVALTALLFLMANNLTSASNAIILQYTMPLFVMLFELVFMKERPSGGEILVSLFVLAGIYLCVYGNGGGGNLTGDILALLSAVTYAGVFSAGKLLHADARNYSYSGNLLCILFVLCIPFDSAFSFGVPGILSAASMGLAVGLGYAFFSRGMKEDVQPTAAAIISNIEPVANPVWVFLFLGERPSAVSLLGFFMVLIAVTLYSAQTASSKGAKSV